METVQPLKLTFYDIALMGAGLGLLLGLIPLVLSFFKGKIKIGVAGLSGSAIGGAILGVFLSIPIIAACIWFILDKPFPKIIGGILIALGMISGTFGFIKFNPIASQTPKLTGEINVIPVLAIIYGILFITAGIAMMFIKTSESETDFEDSAELLLNESDNR